MKKFDTRKLTGLALLTAIVIVLQLIGSAFPLRVGPFSFSFVLIPIVVGAALYGWKAGAWLGFIFGVTVLLSGDAAAFLPINPVGTVLVVLVKGTTAGIVAGLIYKLVNKLNGIAAVFAAAAVCPIVNTGIFLIGCALFFLETISGWAAAAGIESAGVYMVTGLAGVNFLLELLINLVLGPVIVRIIHLATHRKQA